MKKKWIIIGVILIMVAVSGYFIFRAKKPDYNLATVKKGDLIQEVSVTGIVKPAQSVNLAFEKAGKITQIYVEVGDSVKAGQILISQNNSDLVAQLSEAQANVKAQQAKLDELKQGTRPEEIRVQEVKVENAKATLRDKIQDAYTKSDDAVSNKIDQFFSNPKTSNPQFNIALANFQLKRDLEADRVIIETILTSWSASLSQLEATSEIEQYDNMAKTNLFRVKNFLDKVAEAINSLTANSSLSQTTLDGYKSDISTARTNINTAIINLSTAEADLSLQENQLALEKAGTTVEKISAQEAAVEQAKASVQNIEAQLAKTILRAPIDGLVTRQEAKIGETIAANTTVVSIISGARFQIETNVPEVDIAKIKIGNPAKITLDAYGNDVYFDARVVKIDPAETIIEGVATYKTTLQFVKEDERLKSGMTANIDILSDKRENVLFVPQRAVISKNGTKIVNVLEGKDVKEIIVKTGLRGSGGNIEVLEGLKEGEKVILP
jgi:HlyD family secretion protein